MQKNEKAWSILKLFSLVPERFLVVGGNRVFGQSSKNLFEPFLCSSSSCSYFVTLRVLLYQESVWECFFSPLYPILTSSSYCLDFGDRKKERKNGTKYIKIFILWWIF